MATTPRTSSGRKTAARATPKPPTHAEDVSSTIDAVLDDWSQDTVKQQLAWEISASTALLRHSQAVREAQIEASQRAQAAHEEAARQLEKAHGISDLAAVQMSLARADTEGALRYWSRLGELTTRGAIEMLTETAGNAARLQAAAWSALLQWSKLQASLPPSAEVLEAEVEHLTHPVTSSPLVWPAQEATRQAMTLATSTWNDWLSWSGQVAKAGNGAAPDAH